jgi:hypothetical protein
LKLKSDELLSGLGFCLNLRPYTKVVSMSVGGTKSEVVNAAVREMVAAGIPVIVAAGGALHSSTSHLNLIRVCRFFSSASQFNLRRFCR